MNATSHDLPLVARQKLVERVIERLLRPDDARSSPNEFVQPGFYGVAGIGKSRLLHAIRDQALTVTPYVVAFDFDRRRAVDVPGTPWGFVLRLIGELATIDRQHCHWWQRWRWQSVNPFRECETIIAHTSAPTAITQSVVAEGSDVSQVSMTVESMVQPIPPNLQQAFAIALNRLAVRGSVRREYEAALGAKPRPLIVILLDTVEMAPKPIQRWLSEGLSELFAGNTLGFHALVVAAGRQQTPKLITTELPELTPTESVQFLVNYFTHRRADDARFAVPEAQHLLRDDTPTRAVIVELAAGIPLLLQMLADLIADAPYRAFVLPEGTVPQSREARIDYVLQHYIARLSEEAPDDAERARRWRLLLYSAVPRRIPNDSLLHALFADLPGAPMPGDSRMLFTRLARESFVRGEPPAGLVYHEIMRSGFLRHLEKAEPQRWRELHRRAAAWWEAQPDAAETLYHRLRADYAGTVAPMKEAIAAALAAQDWPRVQALIGVAADLELQPADAAWLTLFRAELAWGEGSLPLVHRCVERLCAQPDLPPDLAERLAADLERWFHFTPEMTPGQVAQEDQHRGVWLLWYAQHRSTPALHATVLRVRGDAAWIQARYVDAERYYTEALAVFRQIDDLWGRWGEANGLISLGDVARMQARYADAERTYQAAIVVSSQSADKMSEVKALLGLGDVARMQARYADAERHYQEAVTILEYEHYPLEMVNALVGLGDVARLQARFALAEYHYKDALAISRRIAYGVGEAKALIGLGCAAWMQARYADAERDCREALAVSGQIGYDVGKVNALLGLGGVALSQQRSADAVDHYEAILQHDPSAFLWLGSPRLSYEAVLKIRSDDAVDHHYEAALAVSRKIADRLGEAHALRGLGDAALMQGHYAKAKRHYEEALAASRQIDDRLGESNALAGLGGVALFQDRFADAERHYTETLTVSRQIADRLGEANALIGLGSVALSQARFAGAERHYKKALALYRQIAYRLGEANALVGLGDAALRQARSTDAESRYNEALAVYRQIVDRLGEANALVGLGDAALRQARSTDAEHHYTEALTIYRQIADRLGEANALLGLGRARSTSAVYQRSFYRLGESHSLIGLSSAHLWFFSEEDCEGYYQEALTIYQRIADRGGQANALIGLGDAAQIRSRYADAERHYTEALAVSRQIAFRLGEANALIGLGAAALMQARYDDAEHHYTEALAVYRQIADRLGEAHACRGLGQVAQMQACYDESERHYLAALAVYRQIANPRGQAHALIGLGDATRMQARFTDAEHHYTEALAVFRQIEFQWGSWGEANSLISLGDVAQMQARYADAERSYQEALVFSRKVTYSWGEANALLGLCLVTRMQARYADAERNYTEALNICYRERYRWVPPSCKAYALMGLGDVARMLALPVDAERHYKEALASFRQYADRLGEANALISLGNAAQMRARYADAKRHYTAALDVSRQIDDRLGEATSLRGLGEAALMQARYDDAERHYQDALAVYRQIAFQMGEANALLGLGEATRRQARFADARSYLVQAFDLYAAISMPRDILVFAISNANAVLDQAQPQPDAAHNPALARQAVELARWLLERAEQANAQCAPAIAAAYSVPLQALRVRIGSL